MNTGGITMVGRFLPQRIDNAYRGHTLALWLFAAVVFMKTSIGLGTIFNGRTAAVFAIWGLAQVMIGLLCILALVRYRALVPFLFINLALVALMVVGLVLALDDT